MKTRLRHNNSTFVRYMLQKWFYQCDISHCKPEEYHLYNRYREHYVCFDYRLSSKPAFLRNQCELKKVMLCSSCHKPKINIGLKFRAPSKHNLKEWKKAKTLYTNSANVFTYTSVGEVWDDTIP